MIGTLVRLGAQPVAVVQAAATLALLSAYLLADLTFSLRARAPYGDFAVLWTLSHIWTPVWAAMHTIIKVAALVWVL